MSVVFGWYSFKLKSYSVDDLNLNSNEWNNSIFEVRQKVFHLFWIPFFSLGKLYAVRKRDKLYDLPTSIENIIKEKGKVKTPWYAFLLPILAVAIPIVVGVYIYIAESIMKYNHYKEDKKAYEIAITTIQNELRGLTKNAYLRITNPQKPNSKDVILLKVVDIKDTTFYLQAKKVFFPYYNNERYYFENLSSDTLTFTKSELQKAICTDFDIIREYKPYGIAFLGKDKYIIDGIEYFDEPVIDGDINWDFWEIIRTKDFQYYNSIFTGYKNQRSWSFKLKFQNFGIPARLIQIQNIQGKIQWADSLPVEFKSYEYLKDIYVQANTTSDPDTLKFKSKFIFEDSLKNKYEYLVKGDKSWYTVVRNKKNKR